MISDPAGPGKTVMSCCRSRPLRHAMRIVFKVRERSAQQTGAAPRSRTSRTRHEGEKGNTVDEQHVDKNHHARPYGQVNRGRQRDLLILRIAANLPLPATRRLPRPDLHGQEILASNSRRQAHAWRWPLPEPRPRPPASHQPEPPPSRITQLRPEQPEKGCAWASSLTGVPSTRHVAAPSA